MDTRGEEFHVVAVWRRALSCPVPSLIEHC
jgi:hypothetical protein